MRWTVEHHDLIHSSCTYFLVQLTRLTIKAPPILTFSLKLTMSIAAAKWHERRLPTLLTSLQLRDSNAPVLDVRNDDAYVDALRTILEELDERNSDVPTDNLEMTAQNILTQLGHPDVERGRAHILALLCTELQTSRAIERQKPPPSNDDDVRVAVAISEIIDALGISADAKQLDIVNTAINEVTSRGIKATSPLLPKHELQLDEAQRARIDTIADALHADYAQRRELLLQRLRVTARAFAPVSSRAAAAAETRATHAVHIAQSTVPAPPRYALAHALAARPSLLAPRARLASDRADKVRSVLMGSVPDRGGRVTENAAAMARLMPQFSSRKGASDAPDARRERMQKRKRGGKSKKNRNKNVKDDF